MSSGTITRKEIITDEALNWGAEYAKTVDQAIDKNKELVAVVMAMVEANNKVRASSNSKELAAYLKIYNDEANRGLAVWKEQDALERQLIATKKKNELATESTNQALIKERTLLNETNKIIRAEVRDRLGLVSSYQKLNIARNEAQKRLADLLSAEVRNRKEIALATVEFDKLDARVKAVDAAIKNYSKNIGNYGSAFKGLNGTMRELMSTFGIVTGFALFGTIIKDIFQNIREFDRQLIAVGKTTGISGENLKQFGREVVELGEKLDGVSIDGLLKSAEVAGQLGVTGTSNILKFSEAIEKLKLTSNIISDEQVGQFAKFIEVSSDSFENADKLASVITKLGNSYATTESEVLANATEIQKGIAVYKTSAEGVLALGSATSTLGSEAEASRSAIQSTFAVINNAIATGKNLEQVLKLTGLTQKELSKQFNQDATGVFVKLVGGLKKSKDEGENLALTLGELGITEKRAFTVVGALAANYGVLEGNMAAASEEYKTNAALNKEVADAAMSIDSIIGDLKDKWDAYIHTQNDANSGTKAITTSLRFLRDNFKDIINFILKGGAILLTYVGVMRTVNFVTNTYTALKIAARAAQIQFTIATGIGTVAMKAEAAAAREAAIATESLNVATKATPWGLILGLIAAAVAAYIVLNDELTRTEQLQKDIADQAKKQQETESFYAGERDKNREKDYKAIEDEMALRKAKGENSEKLDKEEIERKKAVVQSEIDVFNGLKQVEIERTKEQIKQTEVRIQLMEREKKIALAAYKYDPPKGEVDFQERRFDTTKDKENLAKLRANLIENSNLTVAEQKRLYKILAELDQQKAIKSAEAIKEESEKAKRAREKARKEYLASLKESENDDYAIRQFRLKNGIALNDEILKNDKASLDDQLDALADKNQHEISLENETLTHKLLNISRYSDEVRDLSDEEIRILVTGGEIKRALNDKEKLAVEQHRASLLELAKKYKAEENKLLDFDAAKFQKGLDQELKIRDTALQNRLDRENETFSALLEGAKGNQDEIERVTEEHEARIFEIKKRAALDALKFQLQVMEQLLKNENLTAEQRIEYENRVATAKRELSDLELTNYEEKSDKKVDIEKEFTDKVTSLSEELTSSLISLVDTIFEARISAIDNELTKLDEYYNKQIELAGNDQRQKDLLTKEAEKKREALEKKKREEQRKQAIFDKAMKVVQIGVATALGIMQAYAQLGPIGGTIAAVLIGALGIAQTAAVLATPIPKYKYGRKDGPEEDAIVGDGGRREVISNQDGSNPRVTPERPTIVRLKKGERVHSSIDQYNEYVRRSMIANVVADGQAVREAQSMMLFSSDNSDLLEEMRLTRKAIERIKIPKSTYQRMPDLNHQLWALSNKNWRS